MTSHRIIGVTIFFAALTIPIGCGTPADVGDEVTAKQTEDTANKLGHRLSRLHHYFHRKEEPHAAEWSYSAALGSKIIHGGWPRGRSCIDDGD